MISCFSHFAAYSKETGSESPQGNKSGGFAGLFDKKIVPSAWLNTKDGYGKKAPHTNVSCCGPVSHPKGHIVYGFLHIFTRGANKYGGCSRQSHTLINKTSPQETLLSTWKKYKYTSLSFLVL